MKSISVVLIYLTILEICLAHDYYTILGVEKSATQDQIRKAYKKQALRYHPDKNNGNKEASEKFIQINKAYDVLKNPKSRAQYDRGPSDYDFDGYTGSHSQYTDSQFNRKSKWFDDFDFHFEPFKNLHKHFGSADSFASRSRRGKKRRDDNSRFESWWPENSRFDEFLEDDLHFRFFKNDIPDHFSSESQFRKFENTNARGPSNSRHKKTCRTVTTNINGVFETFTECN